MNIGFILYDGRSGSTLLASHLNDLEGVHVTLESDFPSRILGMQDDLFEKQNLDSIYSLLINEVQFVELNISLEAIENCLSDKFEGLVSKKNMIECITRLCFDSYHEDHFYVIKHAPTSQLKNICQLFPKAKFIQIIRDPRGVYYSKKSSKTISGMPFTNNVIGSVKNWEFRLKLYANISNLISLRYEDLIEDLDKELQEILEFLEVNWPYKRNQKSTYFNQIGDRQKHLHTNVSGSIMTNNSTKWKDALSPYEIWVIEDMLRLHMNNLNYELKVNSSKLGYIVHKKYDQYRYYARGAFNMILYIFGNPMLLKEKMHKLSMK